MPDCSGAEDNTQNQQQLSDEGVQQEIVSKFMADVVFGKETDVINFVYNNRSLGQKIKDWIVDTLGITKKAGDNDALLKVKENFEKALGFKAENAQKVQYDIKTDKFGNKYWQVETEQDIFKGIESTKELQKKAFEYILRGNKGERVEDIINGEKLKFTRISAEEYVYGIQSQKLSKADTNNEGLYDKKMRLSPSILDLIENADSKYKMKDMKSHNFAKDGFLNYKGRVKIDNIIFKYIVRIGKSEKGNMFYDTNLEVEQRVPGAKSTSPIKHSTSNDVNILSQDKTIVNDSIRDNNRDDTAKYDKDINETEQTSNDVETAENIKEAVKSDDETDLVGSKESGQNLANDEDMGYKEGEVIYSPVNPHPTLPLEVQNSFSGGTFKEKKIKEETTYYRVYGGQTVKKGGYMSQTPQYGGLQSQIDLALNPEWGNKASSIVAIKVPKGTVVYEGKAALQKFNRNTSLLLGGGNQVYIPEVDEGWFEKQDMSAPNIIIKL